MNLASKQRYPQQAIVRPQSVAPPSPGDIPLPPMRVTPDPNSAANMLRPAQAPPTPPVLSTLTGVQQPLLGGLQSLVSSQGLLSSAQSNASGGGKSLAGGSGNTNVQGTAEQKKFAEGVLRRIGVPVSDNNLTLMLAWFQAEGTDAHWNPMATTMDAPGASTFNSAGVKNYRSMSQGIIMTAKTLTNGNYGNIINALKQSANPFETAKAIASSPWGTGQLVLQVLRAGRH